MTISGRAKAIELLRAGMDGAHVVVAMVEVGWSKHQANTAICVGRKVLSLPVDNSRPRGRTNAADREFTSAERVEWSDAFLRALRESERPPVIVDLPEGIPLAGLASAPVSGIGSPAAMCAELGDVP